MYDVVIPYRKNGFDELRTTIRSIAANLPHKNIIIAGDVPEWFKGIGIQTEQLPNKYEDVEQNIVAALTSGWVSDEFYLFNDDMFILQPVRTIPNYHAGMLKQVYTEKKNRVQTQQYAAAIKDTLDLLKDYQIDDPYAYTLHTPMLMNLDNRLELHKLVQPYLQRGKAILTKTVYGNMYCEFSGLKSDVKLYRDEPIEDRYFASTVDRSWMSTAGNQLREMFSEPCKYE